MRKGIKLLECAEHYWSFCTDTFALARISQFNQGLAKLGHNSGIISFTKPVIPITFGL